MESIHLFVSIFLIIGYTLLDIEARSIFDPIRNIFVPPQNENIPGKVIDSFLPPFRDNVKGPGPQFHHDKGKPHRSLRSWWAVDPTPGTPIIHNIFNDPPATPDYDKIVAQQFPEATSLLAKLQELNKIKEEQKKQQGGGGNTGGTGVGDRSSGGSSIGIKQTPQPSDFGDHTKPVTPGDNSGEKPTKTDPDMMKSITKKHFYGQVQPVRPVDENKRTSETIYYVDV